MMKSLNGRRGFVALLVRGMLLALVLCASVQSLERVALAQDDGGDAAVDNEAGMGRSLTKSQVDAMGRVVGLTDQQRKPVADLYQGLRNQMAEATKKMNEFQQSLGSGAMGMPAKEDIKKITEAMKNYSMHLKKLQSQFMEDYKALLTPEQQAKWPKAERRWRLSQAGSLGMMASGTTNLADLAEQLVPPGELSKEAQEVLEQYEAEMDQAVGELLDWRDKMEEDLQSLGEKMAEMTPEQQQKFGMEMMLEGQKKGKASRQVNVRTLPKLAPLLPEGVRDEFQLSYYRGGTLRWYTQDDGKINKCFDSAMKLADLSEEQKAALTETRRSYNADLLALYRGVAEAQDKAMDEAKPDTAIQQLGGGQMMQELFTKRPEIATRTVTKVRAALKPEQLAKLPEPFKPVDVKEPTFEE